jgi:hypothetical protein
MKQRGRGLGPRGAAVLVILFAAAFGWVLLRRGARVVVEPHAVLGAIPRGAIAVAELDLARLRQHPVTRAMLRESRTLPGLGDIAGLCGADPLERVDRLAFAIPADADLGFGVFASGPIEAKELSRCAETIVAKRGGKPVRESRRGFTVIQDAAVAASSAALAVQDGGPLVVAEPGYLSAAMRVARGDGARFAADPGHAELRDAVGEGVFVATAVLTAAQRRTLAGELDKVGRTGSPFASLRAGALALGLDGELRLHGVLACDEREACTRIAELVRAELAGQAATAPARVLGYGAMLARIAVEAEGPRVHLFGTVPVDDALLLVRKALAFLAAASELDRPPSK